MKNGIEGITESGKDKRRKRRLGRRWGEEERSLAKEKQGSHLITWDCFRARFVEADQQVVVHAIAHGVGNYATAVSG